MTHFKLYFLYNLTTTTKHSACSQRTWSNVPRFPLQEEGQRFQDSSKRNKRWIGEVFTAKSRTLGDHIVKVKKIFLSENFKVC